jgi:hypothetical protein
LTLALARAGAVVSITTGSAVLVPEVRLDESVTVAVMFRDPVASVLAVMST